MLRGLILAMLFAAPAVVREHQHGAAPSEKLGTVHFATSCSAEAQPPFGRAMALLHSFEFASAIEGFSAALKADPSCAIAEWGIALSRWSNPFAIGIRPATQLKPGLDAVARARAIGARTARERAYIDAVARLYTDFETVDQRARVLSYRDAMAAMA